MNIFRTELLPKFSDKKVNHNSSLVTIGSCFSDSIGNKLNEYKFPVLVNPFGTVYNPISIHEALKQAIGLTYPTKTTYLEHQGLCFNYNFHSKFCATNEDDLVSQIKTAINRSHEFIKKSKVLIITYGTSFVYKRTDTNEIVANCHKLPGSRFNKRLLSVEEILLSFQSLHKSISENLSIEKIILTVSPVRHIKDTLELNSLSKSILRIACQALINQYSEVEYFPSFEIMMDDLRDYRFYKDDLIHPTLMAEEYIWEKFSTAYLDSQTLHFVKQWKDIQKALNHQPFQIESTSHKMFLRETLARLEELKSLADVEKEITQLKSQLNQRSNAKSQKPSAKS